MLTELNKKKKRYIYTDEYYKIIRIPLDVL